MRAHAGMLVAAFKLLRFERRFNAFDATGFDESFICQDK